LGLKAVAKATSRLGEPPTRGSDYFPTQLRHVPVAPSDRNEDAPPHALLIHPPLEFQNKGVPPPAPLTQPPLEFPPDAPILTHAIARLREAGLEKIVLAENHHDTLNPELAAQILAGAVLGGKRAVYVREKSDGSPVDVALVERQREHRDFMMLAMEGQPWPYKSQEHYDSVERLAHVLANPNLSLRHANYKDGAQHPIEDFVDDPEFSVLATGLAHAVAKPIDGQHAYFPCAGLSLDMPEEYQSPPLTLAASAERYDATARAQKFSRTAFVVQAQLFLAPPWKGKGKEISLYFLRQGYAGMRILDDRVTALVFVPAELMPTLERLEVQFGPKEPDEANKVPNKVAVLQPLRESVR
jgi:hypothetical protein